MKKVMAMLLVIFCIVSTIGCSKAESPPPPPPPIPQPAQGLIVKIECRQGLSSVGIKIACDDAIIDKDRVIIRGINYISGHNIDRNSETGWIGNFQIEGATMIFALTKGTNCLIETIDKK